MCLYIEDQVIDRENIGGVKTKGVLTVLLVLQINGRRTVAKSY